MVSSNLTLTATLQTKVQGPSTNDKLEQCQMQCHLLSNEMV